MSTSSNADAADTVARASARLSASSDRTEPVAAVDVQRGDLLQCRRPDDSVVFREVLGVTPSDHGERMRISVGSGAPPITMYLPPDLVLHRRFR